MIFFKTQKHPSKEDRSMATRNPVSGLIVRSSSLSWLCRVSWQTWLSGETMYGVELCALEEDIDERAVMNASALLSNLQYALFANGRLWKEVLDLRSRCGQVGVLTELGMLLVPPRPC
jgi:hypothetical protein